MTERARGTFDVKLEPQASDAGVGDPSIGRMSIDKQFSGDLSGTSRGEMLAARTDAEGSAGYVAIERVVGALHGKTGTFALQHSGTMARGAPRLSISVVPDSGTDELAGLTGTMKLDIIKGKHTYDFEYALGV